MSVRNVIFTALHDNGWRAFADPTTDAILSALHAAGYVVAPREPTQDMMRCGQAAQRDTPLSMRSTYTSARDCYRAMVDSLNQVTDRQPPRRRAPMKVEDMIEEVADLIGRNSPCVMTKDEARSLARLVAPLIAAAEREACAKVAETSWSPAPPPNGSVVEWQRWDAERLACRVAAAAIRARQEEGVSGECRPPEGERVGLLSITNERTKGADGRVRVLCRCDCGRSTYVRPYELENNRAKSCGCLRIVNTQEKHGFAKRGTTRVEYTVWADMRDRCNNPNSPSYPNYGGRGISVCLEWGAFDVFLANMGARPTPRHTLDRVDNNGNYEPGNCRWATRAEQNRNTSRIKIGYQSAAEIRALAKDGADIASICRLYGIKKDAVRRVLAGKSWPLATPPEDKP